MTIRLDNELNYQFEFDVEGLLMELLKACLETLACPYEVDCNVLITDNEGIQAINREFRKLDSSTDVLSFPIVSFEKPCGFDTLYEDEPYFSQENGELLLGDVAISYEKAIEQAEEYGHSIKREIAFLFVHSVLHLFGYDHINEEEGRIMENKQEEILNGLGITR